MADMKKLLHTFDEADELLNGKIERTNLSTIVASATASVENKKTVLIRGTGRNIESLKVGGRTVQDGTPTPDAPVEVKGVGDKTENLFSGSFSQFTNTGGSGDLYSYFKLPKSGSYTLTIEPKSTFEVVGDIYLGFTEKGGLAKDESTDARYTWIVSPGKTFTKEKKVSVTSNFEYISMYKKLESALTYLLENFNIMLEYGSESSPYIPYGSTKYKIPVSCNGETTNIYLDTPLFDGEAADLINGVKDVKFRKVKIRELDWKYYASQSDTNLKYFYTNAENLDISKYYSECYTYGGTKLDSTIGHAPNGLYDNGSVIFKLKDTRYDNVQSMLDAVGDSYIVYYLSTPTTETFNTSPIQTISGDNELTVDTEITPTSIDVTSFGDYYTKSEVDKMIDNMETVVEYENVIDVVSTTATKIPFATMFPDVNKENVISLVVMTGPYNNDNITRYLDTLMALRITSTVNQKVAVRVRCVYK